MHRGGGVLAETGSDGTGSSGPLGVDEHIKYTRDRQDCRNLQPARKGSVFREENGTVLGQKRACLFFRSYLAVQVPVKEGFLLVHPKNPRFPHEPAETRQKRKNSHETWELAGLLSWRPGRALGWPPALWRT